MKYDLTNLDSRAFENLCADILSKEIGTRVEIFSPGKDGGIDGRFWFGEKNNGILQAKHFPDSKSSEVKLAAKKEVPKVIKKNPERYVFMTSGKLTVKAKEDIKLMFEPFIKREDDIWGYNEIQSYLLDKENFDIVEKYTQLYINSAQIIKKVLGDSVSDILLRDSDERSNFLLSCIKGAVNKFVRTGDFYKALEKLDKGNVVVITGEAGIGKTTLSSMLSFEYVKKGYSFFSIKDVNEAEKILAHAKKVKRFLFYYDDFLGENFARFIRGNEGSEIMQFISRVKKDAGVKLILNSRTTVLNRAIYNNHSLSDGKIKKNEHLLTIENLGDVDKAMMLYKHMYFSDLEDEYIDEIYKNKKYIKIIKHPNFSPRIIEYILDKDRVIDAGIKESKYLDYIIESLDNPKDIWSDYFEKLNLCTKKLIFLITFNHSKHIDQNTLKKVYLKYINDNNLANIEDSSFDYVIKIATNALVQRKLDYKNEYQYTLFNPSVGDYVLKEYFVGDESEITKLVIALSNVDSLEYLTSLRFNGYINEVSEHKILERAFADSWKNKLLEKDYEWLLFIIDNIADNLDQKDIVKILTSFVNVNVGEVREFSGGEFYKLYYLLNKYEGHVAVEKYDFLRCFINRKADAGDFEYLFRYLCENESYDNSLDEEVTEIYIDFINSNIGDYTDIDYKKYVQIEKNGKFSVDEEGILQEVESAVEENFIINDKDEFLSKTSFNLRDVTRDVGSQFIHRAKDHFEVALAEQYGVYDKKGYDNSNYQSYSEIDEIFRR